MKPKSYGMRYIVINWDWGHNVYDRKLRVDMNEDALVYEDAVELARRLNEKHRNRPDDGI